jgi:hypothetical protein
MHHQPSPVDDRVVPQQDSPNSRPGALDVDDPQLRAKLEALGIHTLQFDWCPDGLHLWMFSASGIVADADLPADLLKQLEELKAAREARGNPDSAQWKAALKATAAKQARLKAEQRAAYFLSLRKLGLVRAVVSAPDTPRARSSRRTPPRRQHSLATSSGEDPPDDPHHQARPSEPKGFDRSLDRALEALRAIFPEGDVYRPHPEEHNVWFARCPFCRCQVLTLKISEFKDSSVEFDCWSGCEERLIRLVLGIGRDDKRRRPVTIAEALSVWMQEVRP